MKAYKEGIKRCKKPVGGYINDNIAVTTNMFCLPDGDEARDALLRGAHRVLLAALLQLARLDPAPAGFPKEGPVPKLPPPTSEELKAGLTVGGRQVGAPEEIIDGRSRCTRRSASTSSSTRR